MTGYCHANLVGTPTLMAADAGVAPAGFRSSSRLATWRIDHSTNLTAVFVPVYGFVAPVRLRFGEN